MHIKPFIHDAYREAYIEDEDFRDLFHQLQRQSHVDNRDNTTNYDLHNGSLYMLEKIYVPKGERL